ncbi:RIIa domain-containing protein 1-like [Tubulanus polymorphus]|uniref:RIIa domain-containing protein 1-like n=1 Tax=Tubulanus polymorphus TaxID=672921 RepID=UPI003DA4F803
MSKMAAKPKHDPPTGMEPYDLGGPRDLGALSDDQQEKLNSFKIHTRLENEKYLRNHPEVECLIAGFLGDILKNRPENIREFAAAHFTKSNFSKKIQHQLEERSERMIENRILQNI